MNLLGEKYAKHLEVLGSEERIKILELLAVREMCAQEINKRFFAAQATTSYHLSQLKNAGFIKAEKRGKFIYYSLETENIKNYLKNFVKDFSRSLSGTSR